MGNKRVIKTVICVMLVAAILTLGCMSPAEQSYVNGAGLYAQGRLDDAIISFSKTIELAPDFQWAYQLRGCVYYDKGEYDKAIADFTRAIEIDPEYADAYQSRGDAYDKKGEKGKAEADWSKAKEFANK